ncbi:MAG TPA: site-2 protease family protein, partial [Chondromyces sp.]|nr:site-2 protease family protein [Chondromyces sp.]
MINLLTKIHVHPLLWFVTASAVFTGHFTDLVMVFVIISVHELGHAWAAQHFSWRLKSISFLPFGGAAEVDEHGNRPLKEELIVILAGPIQHVWLAALAYAAFQAGMMPEVYFTTFMIYNVTILCFNLLPIWPLDGGKLIMLWLSVRHPFLKAIHLSLYSSAAFLITLHLIVLLVYPFQLHIWAVFLFLYFSLWKEWKQRHYVFMRFLLERYYGNKSLAVTLDPLPVPADSPLPSV